MTARSGRELLIKKNGTAIAGLRTTTVGFTADGADVTDKMDGGYRTMGDWANLVSFEISGDGVAKTAVIRDIFKAGTGFLLEDVTIVWDDSETWECDVYISSYEETGAHDSEVEFSLTMQSSGAWAEAT